jgi:hypothetical protein
MCKVAFDPHPEPHTPAAIPFSAQLINHRLFAPPFVPLLEVVHAPFPVFTPPAKQSAKQPLLNVSVQKTVCAIEIKFNERKEKMNPVFFILVFILRLYEKEMTTLYKKNQHGGQKKENWTTIKREKTEPLAIVNIVTIL